MGEEEIAAFLSHLNVDLHVAASTQNQAFSALLFLYQRVLDRKPEFISGVERVRRPAKVPVVFSRSEARSVIAQLQGDYRLLAELLYGSGLRLVEALRLRVKDIDFAASHITTPAAKFYAFAGYQLLQEREKVLKPKDYLEPAEFTKHVVFYDAGCTSREEPLSAVFDFFEPYGYRGYEDLLLLRPLPRLYLNE